MGEEAKEKSNWKIGDKVCALLGGGGYAEYAAVKYDMLMPVPENCSMIAALAGQKTEIDLKNIYVRNVRIIGSTLRSRTPEMKEFILSELVKNVFPKIVTGEVKPTIHAVLPIKEAEAAHDILYKGQNVGKVVLKVK